MCPASSSPSYKTQLQCPSLRQPSLISGIETSSAIGPTARPLRAGVSVPGCTGGEAEWDEGSGSGEPCFEGGRVGAAAGGGRFRGPRPFCSIGIAHSSNTHMCPEEPQYGEGSGTRITLWPGLGRAKGQEGSSDWLSDTGP